MNGTGLDAGLLHHMQILKIKFTDPIYNEGALPHAVQPDHAGETRTTSSPWAPLHGVAFQLPRVTAPAPRRQRCRYLMR